MTGHVIHLSTSVNAGAEAIWDVITDLPHAADILRSVKSVSPMSEGEYAVGTTWREDRKFFGHHGEEELHVTESEPPRRTIHETKLGHDSIRTAYSIQPSSDGSSKLLVTATVDMTERTRAENLVWSTWGNLSFEATKRMLTQDPGGHRQGGRASRERGVGPGDVLTRPDAEWPTGRPASRR